MKTIVNPTTGNTEITFNARLVGISEDVKGSTPSGKDYRVGTCAFKNSKGQLVQASVLVFENNYKYGMEIGTEYQTRAIIEKGQPKPLLVMSHLTASARASFEDFGVSAADITAASNVGDKASA